MKRDRAGPAGPAWIGILVVLVALYALSGGGRAEAAPALSGEFGVLQQVGSHSSADFAWFGGDTPFASDRRPTELFGSLRIDGGPGSVALCVDGRHTLRRQDWLAWEDRVTVRGELPLARSLIAFGGWERRYRLGENRFFAGAKLTFGSGRGHD